MQDVWTRNEPCRMLSESNSSHNLQQGCQIYNPTRLPAGLLKFEGAAGRSGLPQNLGPLSHSGHGDQQQKGKWVLTQLHLPSGHFTVTHHDGLSSSTVVCSMAYAVPRAGAITTVCSIHARPGVATTVQNTCWQVCCGACSWSRSCYHVHWVSVGPSTARATACPGLDPVQCRKWVWHPWFTINSLWIPLMCHFWVF